MPIYEYACKKCGRLFEYMQRMSDPPKRKCEACGAQALERQISMTSFHLKGGGWYKDLYASPKPSAGKSEGAGGGSEGGGDSGSTSDSGSSAGSGSDTSGSSGSGPSGPGAGKDSSGSGSGGKDSSGSGSGGKDSSKSARKARKGSR